MGKKSTGVPTEPKGHEPSAASTVPALFENPSLAFNPEPTHPLCEFTDPSLLLVRRLEKWQGTVTLILQYAESQANSQSGITHGLEKTRNVFKDLPHLYNSEGDAPKSAIDQTIASIYNETETLTIASETAATSIRQQIIPPLELLLAEVDQHYREIKGNSLAAMKDIEKLRTATYKQMEGLNTIVHSGAISDNSREDPYVLKRRMAQVIHDQVERENDHARNVVAIQTNFGEFDKKVVKTIQTALIDLEQILSSFHNTAIAGHKTVAETYGAVPLEHDWDAFKAKNSDAFLPTTGFQRDPAKIEFENMNHDYTQAVVEGPLSRKTRVLRSLEQGFYVLTPGGYLHEFKSEDPLVQPLPDLSLFIPECEIEPLDPRNPDEFRVYGKDRSSKMSTKRTYTFRASTESDARVWYEALNEVVRDIATATAVAEAQFHSGSAEVATTSAAAFPPRSPTVGTTTEARGFASVRGTTASNAAVQTGRSAGSAAGVGAGAGAGIAAGTAVGIGATSSSTPSRNVGVADAPSAPRAMASVPDSTEIDSIKEFPTETEGVRGTSPMAATAAATALGISPRLRAQSPYNSYRESHNHSREALGQAEIAPISLERNAADVSGTSQTAEPVARKLDFSAGSALSSDSPRAPGSASHPYSALASDPVDTSLRGVNYDVAQAVGIADTQNKDLSGGETGFTDQQDLFRAHGYEVNGLGKSPASHGGMFTESSEPLPHERKPESGGPFFSESVGEPIFDETGAHGAALSSAPKSSAFDGPPPEIAAFDSATRPAVGEVKDPRINADHINAPKFTDSENKAFGASESFAKERDTGATQYKAPGSTGSGVAGSAAGDISGGQFKVPEFTNAEARAFETSPAGKGEVPDVPATSPARSSPWSRSKNTTQTTAAAATSPIDAFPGTRYDSTLHTSDALTDAQAAEAGVLKNAQPKVMTGQGDAKTGPVIDKSKTKSISQVGAEARYESETQAPLEHELRVEPKSERTAAEVQGAAPTGGIRSSADAEKGHVRTASKVSYDAAGYPKTVQNSDQNGVPLGSNSALPGPPTPPNYAVGEGGSTEGLSKSQSAESGGSNKRFGGKFMSKLRHGFKGKSQSAKNAETTGETTAEATAETAAAK